VNAIRGHSGTLAQPTDRSTECENRLVPLSAWLRIGWLALAADFLYWWLGGAGPLDDAPGRPISQLHAALNVVLYFGGAVLFLVLLVLSWLRWRANERERALN
jgi:hypothetical protein